ncbi:zf-RING_2 domain-containing protein/VWA_3 domain-containing protein [Cephalotus follicularis]|uniref:Zf-RING_2 domain-containing protein/VWA_3 domain-containing protein n=1 Tax=Cephalotus follicularis TaxID=3775 RepID=A0A1Q3B3A4_CEPFO|nr:zf-RING_2 domain-containing protein/VWA_3 domain-containing protein [Cephalotus follicularis]
MGSKWRKAKLALGLKLCVYVPRTSEDSPSHTIDTTSTERLSDAALLSPAKWDMNASRPMTPTPSSHGLRLSKSGSKSSKHTCSICLTKMKQGGGHAIFTAECSHSFHFHCITSNVKHGNQICPVCRAKWKEIPLQGPSLDPPTVRPSIDPVGWAQNDALMTVVRRLPSTRRDLNRRHIVPLFQAPEPGVFDDDDSLGLRPAFSEKSSLNNNGTINSSPRTIEIITYPEVSAVPRHHSYDNFTVLVHLKAAAIVTRQNPSRNQACLTQLSQTPRAPVDLVTVLDISGSMAGTKLALLKRAMGFVIRNLGSSDRLSVIAFSSTARRLFPLRLMSHTGRQHALQAVNSLVANGGTNIAEGLRKGAKVMEDRKEKNPVASIILLSDGQDTYTVSSSGSNQPQPNYQLLLPLPVHGSDNVGFQVPVHAFGFGADHDASSMHSISETSGGTFSFIETEAVIQDAFAQCIGGLLSVVVQELQVGVECTQPGLRIGSLKAGSYPSRVMGDGRTGFIDVGDLYADEERDFLVSIKVPAESSRNVMSLLKARCFYKDPLTKEMATLESEEVTIERPEIAGQEVVSIEVDRQRNRLQAAEAMARARVAAEKGDLARAVSILDCCRRVLSETMSAKSRDPLCVALDAELKEIQERMASRHVYEASGRAYILSGLSSHSWQRATARGDSTDGSSLVHSYQTPSMVEMLTRSQAVLLGSPSTQRLVQPLWPYGSLPNAR